MKQLLAKYNNMPKPVKASFWYTVCNILQRSLSFITLPIFTRMLTSSEYGSINVYQTWFSIIYIFSTLNLQYGSFGTAMSKYEEDRDRYISAVQGLSTVITLGCFLVYLPLQNQINAATELTTVLMIAMCIEMIIQPAFGFWSGKMRFDYKYKAMITISLLSSVLNPILGIYMVLHLEDNVFARIYSALIIQLILYGSLYVINFLKGKAFFVKEYWKFALKFNIPLIPYYVSQIIFNQSDRIMISKIAGNDKAGLYSVAYSLSMVLNFVINAVNNSFVPWKYSKLKKRDCNNVGFVSTGIAGLIMLMMMMLILGAPEIIRIFAAPDYYAARWVVPPVVASNFFLFITQLFINIEFYFEEKKMLVAGSILSAVLNVGLNALLIPVFGFVAAGYTTLISYIVFAGCNYFCAKSVLKKHWPDKNITDIYQIKGLFIMSAAFLTCMVVCTLLYDHMIIRYCIFAGIAIGVIIKRQKVLEYVKMMKNQ